MVAGLADRRADRLVPVKAAARVLGWSADSIRDWVNDGKVPAVRTPGGQISIYASWLGAVLASAKPGRPGDMTEVTDQWWAERGEAAA